MTPAELANERIALDEFRAKVREDNDRPKSLQYLGFANIVAATWCPERIEK